MIHKKPSAATGDKEETRFEIQVRQRGQVEKHGRKAGKLLLLHRGNLLGKYTGEAPCCFVYLISSGAKQSSINQLLFILFFSIKLYVYIVLVYVNVLTLVLLSSDQCLNENYSELKTLLL